ncbi:hypothetical protein CR532_05270 (plasmid) [Candidatus Borreliella tachyglossi]|uniref:Uncharacterized protein n=1 Tax=Candidatus Borreliella tachyglossi TaxID=1964448 RepID=A0A2S1LYP5_9SPIR|nr:DUF792 family protein [Candidatus Borreliella tachyglossi]AWG43351.1 hypothetical protein CR532_04960 [Candidatus Borreliella tachyglossi]AWG43406.1 hypothetical protein CR532_05270 [Candidatus Borreliella tachyglossi]
MDKHEILHLIKATVNQVFSFFSSGNFIVLFPRMDLKGFGYIPQLFFIEPKGDLIIRTYSTSCSKRPVINYYTRKAEYVTYNPVLNSEVISITGGVLTSIYKEMLSPLKMTPFGNSLLQYDSNFVKEQLANRIEAGVPFTAYSPTFQFKELVILTSVTFKDTPYIDEIEINLNIEVVKTFTLNEYKG